MWNAIQYMLPISRHTFVIIYKAMLSAAPQLAQAVCETPTRQDFYRQGFKDGIAKIAECREALAAAKADSQAAFRLSVECRERAVKAEARVAELDAENTQLRTDCGKAVARVAELESNPGVCCGSYSACNRPCTPREEWLATQRIAAPNGGQPLARTHSQECPAVERGEAAIPEAADKLISISLDSSTHTRLASEWLALARADLATSSNAAVPSVALTKLSGDEKGESDRAQTTAAPLTDEPKEMAYVRQLIKARCEHEVPRASIRAMVAYIDALRAQIAGEGK